MTGYLLDTDICIEILRKNPKVLAKARVRRRAPAKVSTITAGELFYGAWKSDASRREDRLQSVREFLEAAELIAFDLKAAERYGAFKADLARQGLLIGDNDLQIASIAVAYGLVLVSNNTQHFTRLLPLGLKLESWLKA